MQPSLSEVESESEDNKQELDDLCWHDIEVDMQLHNCGGRLCDPTDDICVTGYKSDEEEKDACYLTEVQDSFKGTKDGEEPRVPRLPTMKSKTAARNKSKRCTRWLSQVHAGLDSIIVLAALAHGASNGYFLFTLPLFKRHHEHYEGWLNVSQGVSSAIIVILLPISRIFDFATKSGQVE